MYRFRCIREKSEDLSERMDQGKSTVTSIVAGMQPCDSGKMFFKGQEWKPQSMIDALHRGIGMIVQESGTIQGVTVAENIFLAETEKYKNKIRACEQKKNRMLMQLRL